VSFLDGFEALALPAITIQSAPTIEQTVRLGFGCGSGCHGRGFWFSYLSFALRLGGALGSLCGAELCHCGASHCCLLVLLLRLRLLDKVKGVL
jgi:hypothetical protein